MEIKITVIVTIHNAEPFLHECLESVITQTFNSIEILCIDGGSTDSSPDILLQFAQKDSRIKIINDPNTSYGHKINRGISEAKGKYISVLESDDMYEPDMLESLYEIAEKYNVDYVNADYYSFFYRNDRYYKTYTKMYPESDYNKLIYSSNHTDEMRQILRYWTGIFSKDYLLYKNIFMNESPGASFQDMSFRFLTSALADRAYHINKPVYRYRIDNPSSSVNNPKKAIAIVKEYAFLKNQLIERKISDENIWRSFYTWKYNDYHGNIIRFDGDARTEMTENLYKELNEDKDHIKNLFKDALPFWINRFYKTSHENMLNEIENEYQNIRNENILLYSVLDFIGYDEFVLFCCGARGHNILEYFRQEKRIKCISDNNSALWGSMIEGVMVISPEKAVEKYGNKKFVIANKKTSNEIKAQLIGLGISENQIITY